MVERHNVTIPGPKPCAVAWMRKRQTGVGSMWHEPDGRARGVQVGFAVCVHCGCIYQIAGYTTGQ